MYDKISYQIRMKIFLLKQSLSYSILSIKEPLVSLKKFF